MILQILRHTDTNEVADIANNTIQELQKYNWIRDLYLNGSLKRLIIEAEVLNAAVGLVLKNDFTQELMVQDAIFDQIFNGFKQFVKANTYSIDKDKANNAERIYDIFEVHDINLYRLDHEQQIFLCDSLLNLLDNEINKAAVASLDGVSAYVDLLKNQNDSFRKLLQESNVDERVKAEGIAASIQKHVVLNVLNKDILPYMEVMSKAKSEAYRASFNAVSDFITAVNIRVNTRNISKENRMEESLL